MPSDIPSPRALPDATLPLQPGQPGQPVDTLDDDRLRFFGISLDLLCTASLSTGCFVLLNPAWQTVLGYPLAYLRARPFLEFVHLEDQASTIEAAQALGAGNKVIRFINRYRHADGSYRWIEWTSTAIPARDTIYAVARDITERIQVEEQLRVSQEQSAQLVAQLQEKNEQLRKQGDALRELATPIIPIADDLIVMPLIGTVDQERATQIMEAMLSGISSLRIKTAIIDITGVTTIDTFAADALVRIAKAVRLLGAEVVLTGIQAKTAQALVALGVALEGLVTRSTLQEAISWALQGGVRSVPRTGRAER